MRCRWWCSAGGPSRQFSWSPVAAPCPGLGWAQWVMSPETALLDAVQVSFELMDGASHGGEGWRSSVRRARDRQHDVALGRRQCRRQSETAVYALELIPPGRRRPPPIATVGAAVRGAHVRRALHGTTGGRFGWGAADHQRAEGGGGQRRGVLSPDLRSQYLVGYASSRPMDGKYRRIKVEAKDRDLRLRHRGGYLAMPGEVKNKAFRLQPWDSAVRPSAGLTCPPLRGSRACRCFRSCTSDVSPSLK